MTDETQPLGQGGVREWAPDDLYDALFCTENGELHWIVKGPWCETRNAAKLAIANEFGEGRLDYIALNCRTVRGNVEDRGPEGFWWHGNPSGPLEAWELSWRG